MASYRKVDKRTWADQKVRQLSKPQPNAQSLWFYLMTGPQTNPIPGLFRLSLPDVADFFDWSLDATKQCLQEITSLGMAIYNQDARLCWLPNAIQYNRPENPNVVKSWRQHWDELPECPQKIEAGRTIAAGCNQSEAFREAFAEAFREAFAEGYGESGTRTGTGTRAGTGTKNTCPDKPGTVVEDGLGGKGKHTSPAKAKRDKAAPRKPDELFDAVAEVTASDPQVSGSHIGRICKALRSADPPYTPAEVRKFAAMAPGKFDWFKGQLTLGMIEKYIGIVRAKGNQRPRVLTDEDIAHGDYSGQTGFTPDTKTCTSPTCKRPACVSARGDHDD